MTKAVKRRRNTTSAEELAKKAEIVADELADRAYGEEKPTAGKESQALSKRCNFSLNEQVSKEIDDLTSITSRVTRSDIVKASIYSFSLLDEDEQVKIVNIIKKQNT